MKRIEESLRDPCDNIKRTNIRIIGVPEEEEKKKGTEKIFEEITVEHVPNMGKEIVIQVQEAQTPRQDKPKEKHTKTHSNQTIKNKIQRKDIESRKGKATNNIKGNPHKVNS